MQDQYAGDVGDFGKYGLLRAVAGHDMRLGVLWYRVPNDGGTDGRHVAYLRKPARFRPCDPDLFDALSRLSERSVGAIAASGILPSETIYHDRSLMYDGLRGAARGEHRRAWHAEAVATTAGCQLVYADPDNGIEVPSVERHELKGPKYLYLDDLDPFIRRNQSSVIYHHLSRRGTATEQARHWQERLSQRFGVPCQALLFRAYSCRVFFVLIAPAHAQVLSERVRRLGDSAWRSHFELL